MRATFCRYYQLFSNQLFMSTIGLHTNLTIYTYMINIHTNYLYIYTHTQIFRRRFSILRKSAFVQKKKLGIALVTNFASQFCINNVFVIFLFFFPKKIICLVLLITSLVVKVLTCPNLLRNPLSTYFPKMSQYSNMFSF